MPTPIVDAQDCHQLLNKTWWTDEELKRVLIYTRFLTELFRLRGEHITSLYFYQRHNDYLSMQRNREL